MEPPKENPLEIQFGTTAESFRNFIDSQTELFHSQIDQLQNVVVTQCRLTGANPLSQEMAAGALSIKIGKRPRDLLNPKAIKYMQAIFSVKDAISKKECRDISAQFGVTVTQVKEFFAGQRSRVRKFVRLSREKGMKLHACKESLASDTQNNLDSTVTTNPVPLNCIGPSNVVPTDLVPLNSIRPPIVEETPACSGQDGSLIDIDDLDKHFIDNIFNLMREEETFSGQVKLMEWILRIQNPSVLSWFLSKGGVMILATWLIQAAVEEQTSALLVILKVLSHLPLHKALPEHMSAVLQSVNKLRFYRASDISNRARFLLSKWSKMLVKSQAMKKSNGIKSSADAQNELILKQSIGEIMADEAWHTGSDVTQAICAPAYGSSENFRKLECPQPLKLLGSSVDDSAKRNILGVSASHNRERRKVQLMEQPGQKLAGRSTQAARAAAVKQSRPMSADDIQKAKLRAHYMQSKHMKASSSNGSDDVKEDTSNQSSVVPASISPSISKVNVVPKAEEQKKTLILSPEVASGQEASIDTQKVVSKEHLQEKEKMVVIAWKMPPEIKLNDLWRISAGQNSKEVEAQRKRNQREKETIYHRIQEVPSNPKEPWDREMDYDDSLTPEIPSEQPPDAADSGETTVAPSTDPSATSIPIPSLMSNASASTSTIANEAKPDLQLLAVLLKNPDLVFALSAAQADSLSNEDTVKLLDMIKAGAGADLPANTVGLGVKVEERVEVSLPSPTPASNPGMSGWREDVARNQFSASNGSDNPITLTSMARSHVPVMNNMPQHSNTMQSYPQQFTSGMHSSVATTTAIPEYNPSMATSVMHNSPSEMHLTMKNQHITGPAPPNLPSAAGPSMRVDTLKAVPSSTRASERQSIFSSRSQPQPQLRQHYSPDPMHASSPYTPRPPVGNLGSISDPWRANQASASVPRYQGGTSTGGPLPQTQMPHDSYRARNRYVGNDGFESWSPEDSPTRPPEYTFGSGRNFQEPGMSYRSENRSRQWNSTGYQDIRDDNKYGNRRWQDRRR